MREIECCVDFVQDVHRRWLELEEGHDERDGDQGALASGQFCKGLFPYFACDDVSGYAVAGRKWIIPRETLTSNPSLIVLPSGGSNFAKLPGSNSAKI